MVQKRRASAWIDKTVRLIEKLQYNDAFREDVRNLLLFEDDSTEKLLNLADKYSLPSSSIPILLNYAETGKISHIEDATSLAVICDTDQTCGPTDNKDYAEYLYVSHRGFTRHGVELFIPSGSSLSEVKSFIDDNWEYVESKIGKPDIVRRSPKAERDAEVIRLVRTGKHTHTQIADIIENDPKFKDDKRTFTYTDVAQIVSRNNDIKKPKLK